jgi:hypothetical protein
MLGDLNNRVTETRRGEKMGVARRGMKLNADIFQLRRVEPDLRAGWFVRFFYRRARRERSG